MRNKIADEEKLCIYCEHSTPIMDTDVCVCDKKGVVNADGCCNKFVLDLLKVKPRPPKAFESADPELFQF